jgi:MoaA/NifB/PqqE/SkfB family radical SAM enzyme
MNEEGNYFAVSYPNKDEREQLFGYISNLKTPVYQDDILLEMIISESDDYFKGVESVEKTVEKIINNAKLYMEE